MKIRQHLIYTRGRDPRVMCALLAAPNPFDIETMQINA